MNVVRRIPQPFEHLLYFVKLYQFFRVFVDEVVDSRKLVQAVQQSQVFIDALKLLRVFVLIDVQVQIAVQQILAFLVDFVQLVVETVEQALEHDQRKYS